MYKVITLCLLMTNILGATNGVCPSADQYCADCLSDVCSSCHYAYKDVKVCKPPTTKIDHCVSYLNATTCSACDWGYELKSNKCEKITIDNCLVVVLGKCTVCKDKKKNNTTDGKCTTTACTKTNCDNCTVATVGTVSTEVCVQCSSGYANVLGSCVKEVTANCMTQGATKCTACKKGYYDKNDTCVKSDLQSSELIVKVFGTLLAFFLF